MNEDLDLLDALPRLTARAGFDQDLYGDALQYVNLGVEKVHHSHKASIWVSFVMAASLGLGLWMGLNESSALQGAMSGLGFQSVDSSYSDFLSGNAYAETLSGLSS